MVTNTEIETYLGVVYATYTAELDLLKEITFSEIETLTDRNLREQSYVGEKVGTIYSQSDLQIIPAFDIRGIDAFYFLDQYPVTTITVKSGGQTLTEDDDYKIDRETGIIGFVNSRVCGSPNELEVDYTAGYSDANMPFALKGLALEGVKIGFQKSGTTSQGQATGDVKSKRTGTFQVTYESTSSNQGASRASGGGISGIKQYIRDNGAILNKFTRISI